MKRLSEIGEPDVRQRMFTGSLADLHSELTRIQLNETVPTEVRDLFDTAMNASLYSWFVYDFHPVADLTGFLAMEAALRARASRESKSLANKPLKQLVRYALTRGWVTEDGVAGRQEIARVRVHHRKSIEAMARARALGVEQMLIEQPTEEEVAAEAKTMRIIEAMFVAGVDLRNALAHGERMLMPGSHERLRTTAGLINQLFPAE